MKPKLKVFEQFSNAILPHEAQYLLKIGSFQDEGKKDIFNKLIHNALFPNDIKEFNEDLDKRKYHYIRTWIETKLYQIDVDKIGDWLLDFKRKLFLDLITSEEEKKILEYVKAYKKIGFNFMNVYEIMKEYRSYLLIRLRYGDHEIVNDFLNKYSSAYEKSRKIQEKLYQATIEITENYTGNSDKNIVWEKWLKKVFLTDGVNGSNRYKAFILLAFLYNSNRNTEKLKLIFDEIDHFFSQGEMYCRRLLYNYYSSRVLLHSKQNEIEKAIYYGKLSVRQNNEDTLMYVNNLVSIYLRARAFPEAKILLESYESHYEKSHNHYRRISYISYYLRILFELGLYQKAENIGSYFLKKFTKEIFEFRWHHFFTSYINILLIQEKYNDILALEQKYNIIELEKKRQHKNNFIPNLAWSILLAYYMENKISKNQLINFIDESLEGVSADNSVMEKAEKILTKNLPELDRIFKSHFTKVSTQ